MTSPQGRDRITAEEVPQGAEDRMLSAADSELAAELLADILNMRAIRRLVVRKCVDGITVNGTAELTDHEGVEFWPPSDLINALCPEETPR
jgi:hypothetical protein